MTGKLLAFDPVQVRPDLDRGVGYTERMHIPESLRRSYAKARSPDICDLDDSAYTARWWHRLLFLSDLRSLGD